MAVSVNTPTLDREILKLRRTVGDIYDESGNAMVLDIGGAGGIYLGNPALVSTWSAGEMLDAYNTASIKFIEYVRRTLDKSKWHEYIRGYIIHKSTITITGGKVNLDTLSPKLWVLMNAIKDGVATPTFNDIGVEIPLEEYFTDLSAILKTRGSQLLYTFFNDGTNNVIQFLGYGSATAVNLVYLKQHIDFVHDSATPGDATVFTPEGLERVRIIAEKVIQRYRSQEVRDLPEAMETREQELDQRSK